MKLNIVVLVYGILAFGTYFTGYSQGLPPGWEYSPTPVNHIISVPLTSEPNINGVLLNPGDWIGVFFTNDDGDLACGGATEWLGDQNTGIIAFGNDSFTGIKDGFASGETITYRFYSWSVQKEYDAEAICNDNLPVTCSVFISNGLSGCDSIWANGFYIVASATPDEICSGSNTQLLVQPSGGSGNYSYSWTSVPAGFASSIANPIASPGINTTFFIAVQDVDEILETSILVNVYPQPISNAGVNITVCEDSTVSLSGEQSNGSGFFWSTNGDGSFNNINLLSPQYTPGPMDIDNGDAELTLTVNPIDPCLIPAESSMELTIIGFPVVDVGENQTVCEDENVFASVTLLNAIELIWSTTGDGTFSNPTQIETQYFPGPSDIQNGSVELSTNAFPLSPCTGTSSDSFQVVFGLLPEVYAGEDQLVCEANEVLLSGSVMNESGFVWETTGDGTFINANEIETSYFPGILDIDEGTVDVVLSAEAIEPCSVGASDVLTITIIKNPDAFAGNDATICETANLQLNGAAANFDDVLWTSSGDGTFTDPNNLSTIYHPGENDIQNTMTNIVLIAEPLFPCVLQNVDSLVTYYEFLPNAVAGSDVSICENDILQLNGSASNFDEILWTTSGDGTFADPNSLSTIYHPGSLDIQNGQAHIVLQAEPIFPCLFQEVDSLTAFIELLPYVNAGSDFTIPEGDSFECDGEAVNFSEIEWSTNGDGTFNNTNILNAVYTPGIVDIANASALLTLEASPNSPCTVSDFDDLTLTIDTLVGINEYSDRNGLFVFPNPTTGIVNISFDEIPVSDMQIKLYNRDGGLVFDQWISNTDFYNNREITLDLPQSKGVFILHIKNGDQIYYRKILIVDN